MTSQKRPKVVLIPDSRLPREKSQIFDRLIYALSGYADIHELPANFQESDVLAELNQNQYNLILAPWYRYLHWNRVEAFYGLTRTSGPTFAGYFSDRITTYDLGELPDYNRCILLDYHQAPRDESIRQTLALADDQSRWSLVNLVDPQTTLWSMELHPSHNFGQYFDYIYQVVPGLNQKPWSERSLQIQTALLALRNMIYDEGPWRKSITSSSQIRAGIQIAVESEQVLIRALYNMPTWNSPKDILNHFWPKLEECCNSAHLLRKTSDWMRAHLIAESHQVEIVVGFNIKQPSIVQPNDLRTLWIEPLSKEISQLENVSGPEVEWIQRSIIKGSHDSSRESTAVAEFKEKADVLQQKLREKEAQIHELTSGGVGVSQPMAPPDAESLLDALEDKYHDALFQIRLIQDQLNSKEGNRAVLRSRLDQWKKREQEWASRLAELFKAHKDFTGGIK